MKDSTPEFSEGLYKTLSAIHANVNENIISPTLSHFIATIASRLFFSHETAPFLLAQMEDYLHGKILVSHLDQQRVRSSNFGQIHRCTILCVYHFYWRIFAILNFFRIYGSNPFSKTQLYTQIKKTTRDVIITEWTNRFLLMCL